MKSKSKNILLKAVVSLILLLCAYIMFRGLGLVPGLDFGAGAYYYADIPDFEKYMDSAHAAYDNATSTWLCISLFLLWGWLMWRLWVFVDNS